MTEQKARETFETIMQIGEASPADGACLLLLLAVMVGDREREQMIKEQFPELKWKYNKMLLDNGDLYHAERYWWE